MRPREQTQRRDARAVVSHALVVAAAQRPNGTLVKSVSSARSGWEQHSRLCHRDVGAAAELQQVQRVGGAHSHWAVAKGCRQPKHLNLGGSERRSGTADSWRLPGAGKRPCPLTSDEFMAIKMASASSTPGSVSGGKMKSRVSAQSGARSDPAPPSLARL